MYRKGFYLWGELDREYLLTNDLGRFIFLPSETFAQFRTGTLSLTSDTYHHLEENGFLFEGNSEDYVRRWKDYYSSMKGCLLTSTQLFILALTTACNQRCIYCQAGEVDKYFSMSKETCMKAIDIASDSPTSIVTIEFQGGEPTLNPEVLHFAVPYAKQVFSRKGKQVNFAIVTNLTAPDPDLLDWLIGEGVSISTSLDGHRELHNFNRPLKNHLSTFDQWETGLQLCRSLYEKHGYECEVGAIQTTTRQSLAHPHEIVKAYIEHGYHNLYIRPLTPLGCAAEEWKQVGYTPQEYLCFYTAILDDLFQRCKTGTIVTETTASIYLRRILLQDSVGHTEFRSPCGAAVGQMAVNYDGQIYTCDEGRMLANMGDLTFRLGDVENTYEQLVTSPAAHATCTASCVETLPLCSGCVYHPFCSVCPVVTYSMEKDLVSHENDNYHCAISKGILQYLFRRIRQANDEEMRVLYKWAK